LALSLNAFAGAGFSASDWPQFRGPDRQGRSDDVGLLKSWPSGGPKRVWHVTGIGTGYASAAIADGVVYTSGLIGDEIVISALKLDGEVVWRKPHGPAWKKNYPGSRATPTISDGRLYYLSGHGLLACYDAKTGARKWTKELGSFGGRPGGWGYAESVLIHGNAAIVTPGGRNCIVALDKTKGTPIWTSTGLSDRPGYASCVAFRHNGADLIANMTAKALVCVSARDGRFLWRNDRAAGRTAVVPSPVYSDGYVFGASGYGNGGACVRVSDGSQAWETDEMVCHHGGYVVHEGHIYGNHGGGWSCLELTTGRKKWGGSGVGKGSIIFADGMLYLFGERGGRAGLAEASPEGLKMRGEFSVEGRGPSWAHPAVAGGRLYLRYADNLYAFNVRDPSYTPPRPVSETPPPPKKEPARARRTAPRPPAKPRPKTPEELARRLWNSARNYLANGAVELARRKLEEIVRKYPDTKYGPMAKNKLRSLE
jgi:outer membrane protein assembly factor BamB